MKKIINGKKYDTETAKEIGRYECNLTNGLDYLCETLYLKKTGEFFLTGEGGARTRYGKATSDGEYCSGKDIEPLTEREAREWLEEHGGVDVYESVFGEVEE